MEAVEARQKHLSDAVSAGTRPDRPLRNASLASEILGPADDALAILCICTMYVRAVLLPLQHLATPCNTLRRKEEEKENT